MFTMPKMPSLSPIQRMALGLLAVASGAVLSIKGADVAVKGYLGRKAQKAQPALTANPEPPLSLN